MDGYESACSTTSTRAGYLEHLVSNHLRQQAATINELQNSATKLQREIKFLQHSSKRTPISLTTKNMIENNKNNATATARFSKLVKECQNIISFVCMETLFGRSPMKDSELNDFLFNSYHGSSINTNLLIQSELFITGEGRFSTLFDVAGHDGSITGMMSLRSEVTQDTSSNYFVSRMPLDSSDINRKNTITLSLLKAKFPNSTVPISGRTIKLNGDKVLANCKVAIAIGKSFLDSNGQLPSGCSRQDYYNHVLDGMHKKLRLEPKAKLILDGDEREKFLSEERHSDWIFPGLMAFAAFGPLATDDDAKSNLMMHGMCLVYHFFIIIFNFTNIPF